jgi:hypothetical protein
VYLFLSQDPPKPAKAETKSETKTEQQANPAPKR